jgi:hypothetical protein
VLNGLSPFWELHRSDLQIPFSSLIITGLFGQPLSMCSRFYCPQISVIEELHGKAWENRAAEGETWDINSWHGRCQHHVHGGS